MDELAVNVSRCHVLQLISVTQIISYISYVKMMKRLHGRHKLVLMLALLQQKQRQERRNFCSATYLGELKGVFFFSERHNLWRLKEEQRYRQMRPPTGLAARTTKFPFCQLVVSACENLRLHQ